MDEMKTESEAATGRFASVVERIVSCRWWQRHKFTKWEDFAEAETHRGRPVLIQERRCAICNKAERRTELMF